MKLSKLYQLTYIYLALPLFIFILSWLDAAFAVLFALLFATAFYKAFPQTENNEEICSRRCLVYMTLLAAFWCFFAGIGYFYYQSFDYHFRNAVFRDLINYDWPVFYDKADTPLVYYMAFWLVPAALTKAFSLLIHNAQTLFYLGNIFLFIWASCGIVLVFAHLARALKISASRKILTAAVLFILFSGLDIIGRAFFVVNPQPFAYHLDSWALAIQYSSPTTGLFWVFNQFIPLALLILLVYNERNISNFGFLAVLALFFSPYPAFGTGVFMIAYAAAQFCQAPNKSAFISNKIFSIPNHIGVFLLLPLVVLYFITNSGGIEGWHYILNHITPTRLLLFMLLEFLLYASILFPHYYRDIFFRTMLVSLTLIPLLKLDQQNNFCMRASIPAIIMLAVFTLRFIFEHNRSNSLRTGVLCCLLMLGALTPLTEFYRGFHNIATAHKITLVRDGIYTLNQAYIRMPEFGYDVNHQFTARTYRNDIFWQYLSALPKH